MPFGLLGQVSFAVLLDRHCWELGNEAYLEYA